MRHILEIILSIKYIFSTLYKSHLLVQKGASLKVWLCGASSFKLPELFSRFSAFIFIFFITATNIEAQINSNGCVAADIGINSTLYANSTFTSGFIIPPAGNVDWFKNATGRNIIDQSNVLAIQTLLQNNANPIYERRQNGYIGAYADEVLVGGVRKRFKRLVDAVWARDQFGGTGGIDGTSYNTASKNGEDPAIWDGGPQNVLGKNDLIDVSGHMVRNVDVDANINDLWFAGIINRAEPGGDSYMDFEFFIHPFTFNSTTSKFTSGGPQLGHTAFTFDAIGNITGLGDMIFNLALTNGGSTPALEVRVWVSHNDYLTKTPASFSWGPNFDGAFNGAPYGYASIIANPGATICGFVNSDGQLPLAPPWGTRNTKNNVYENSYSPFSVSEVALNLTAIGLDNYLVTNAALDSCTFPWRTFLVKTRASNAFTAQLKDFAGPYSWAQPSTGIATANGTLSCNNPMVILTANPLRNDVVYNWSTTNGNIIGSTTGPTIQVDKPGTYNLTMVLPTGCPVLSAPIYVTADPTQPQITSATTSSTVSCSGSNGTVNLTFSGGTAPYSFTWTKDGSPFGATTQNLTGLTPGSYIASISDSKGCSKTSSGATVASATPINISPAITHVTCNGLENGSIIITPVSGNMPFTYLWSNGQSTQNLLNVGAGNYSLTVTDATNCFSTFNYTINQPAAVSVTGVKVDDTDPNIAVGNGSITLTATGGTSPYNYAWSGINSFTSTLKDITNLRYGNYSVIVTDANGCTGTLSFFIYEPESCSDNIDNDNDGQTDCDDTECKPAIPGIITGNNAACINQNYTYNVPQVASNTYQWVVPANATIISGQGTNTVVIRWNSTTPGIICVTTNNGSCTSDGRCFNVNPANVPPAPTAIIKT